MHILHIYCMKIIIKSDFYVHVKKTSAKISAYLKCVQIDGAPLFNAYYTGLIYHASICRDIH